MIPVIDVFTHCVILCQPLSYLIRTNHQQRITTNLFPLVKIESSNVSVFKTMDLMDILPIYIVNRKI